MKVPSRIPLARLARVLKGPRVLVTSLPKSGTHLVIQPLYRAGMALRPILEQWALGEEERRSLLASVRRGEALYGHIPYEPERAALLAAGGVRVVVLLRDPRDVAVSMAHYIFERGEAHRLGPYFRERLPDFESRLEACILGVPAEDAGVPAGLPDLGSRFRAFHRWSEEGAFLCRYEELTRSGGGGEEARREALGRLFAFLGLPGAGKTFEGALRSLDETHGATFRKGGSGGWKNHFTPRHREALQRVFPEGLQRYGYGEGAGAETAPAG
ncbi:MAG: sulfotransferase domain-containing protein [Acidobacteriota bacterium]